MNAVEKMLKINKLANSLKSTGLMTDNEEALIAATEIVEGRRTMPNLDPSKKTLGGHDPIKEDQIKSNVDKIIQEVEEEAQTDREVKIARNSAPQKSRIQELREKVAEIRREIQEELKHPNKEEISEIKKEVIEVEHMISDAIQEIKSDNQLIEPISDVVETDEIINQETPQESVIEDKEIESEDEPTNFTEPITPLSTVEDVQPTLEPFSENIFGDIQNDSIETPAAQEEVIPPEESREEFGGIPIMPVNEEVQETTPEVPIQEPVVEEAVTTENDSEEAPTADLFANFEEEKNTDDLETSEINIDEPTKSPEENVTQTDSMPSDNFSFPDMNENQTQQEAEPIPTMNENQTEQEAIPIPGMNDNQSGQEATLFSNLNENQAEQKPEGFSEINIEQSKPETQQEPQPLGSSDMSSPQPEQYTVPEPDSDLPPVPEEVPIYDDDIINLPPPPDIIDENTSEEEINEIKEVAGVDDLPPPPDFSDKKEDIIEKAPDDIPGERKLNELIDEE